MAAFLQVLHKNSKFCEFTAPQQKINLGAYNSARSSSLHPVAEHGRRCSIPASHMRCSGNVLALSQPQPPSSGLCFSLAPARSSALALVGLTLHSSPFCILALCWASQQARRWVHAPSPGQTVGVGHAWRGRARPGVVARVVARHTWHCHGASIRSFDTPHARAYMRSTVHARVHARWRGSHARLTV